MSYEKTIRLDITAKSEYELIWFTENFIYCAVADAVGGHSRIVTEEIPINPPLKLLSERNKSTDIDAFEKTMRGILSEMREVLSELKRGV